MDRFVAMKKVLTALVIEIVIFVVSVGFVSAASVSVKGRARVINTDGFLDFTNYNSNVTVDNEGGNFSGYAFLEDIGWVDFSGVTIDLASGVVSGSAEISATSGILDFTNYNSNVSANISSGVFSGYVFSQDLGWIDFSEPGVNTNSITLDTVAPLGFSLDSPGGDTYTTNTRPTYRWKTTSDELTNIASYSLEVDNGDSGDFSIANIPAERTEDWVTAKYTAKYSGFSDSDTDNNYISVYTHSSSEWVQENNDGELKEGKRIWKVKAKDSNGNERVETRTLFVDLTAPTIGELYVNQKSYTSNLATPDVRPVISGRLIDYLAGDKDENKVASGPNEIEIKIEKQNFSGLYEIHSLVNIKTPKSFWLETHEEIIDNGKQLYAKYSDFSFSPAENFARGKYRISLKGKDSAGNMGSEIFFNLEIVGEEKIREIIEKEEEDTADIGIEKEKEKISEKEAEDLVVSIPEEIEDGEGFLAKLGGFVNRVYWRIVGTTKSGITFIAQVWKGYSGFVHEANERSLAFVGRQISATGQTLAGTYNSLTQKAPGVVGRAMLAFNNALGRSGTAIASVFNSTTDLIASTGWGVVGYFSPMVDSAGQFVYRQQVKISSIAEILFDEDPTVISSVKVAEVGRDYVVITWETNHYTKNNKINYGRDLSYGQDVISQERARRHEFKIDGLEPGTKYYFEVMSQNKNYVYNAYHEFSTLNE